jgi:hypothetical protein
MPFATFIAEDALYFSVISAENVKGETAPLSKPNLSLGAQS